MSTITAIIATQICQYCRLLFPATALRIKTSGNKVLLRKCSDFVKRKKCYSPEYFSIFATFDSEIFFFLESNLWSEKWLSFESSLPYFTLSVTDKFSGIIFLPVTISQKPIEVERYRSTTRQEKYIFTNFFLQLWFNE